MSIQPLTFINAQGKVVPKYQLIEASVCDLYFTPGENVPICTNTIIWRSSDFQVNKYESKKLITQMDLSESEKKENEEEEEDISEEEKDVSEEDLLEEDLSEEDLSEEDVSKEYSSDEEEEDVSEEYSSDEEEEDIEESEEEISGITTMVKRCMLAPTK